MDFENEEDFEEDEEPLYNSYGINLETGEYDPEHDAFYPPISSFGLLKQLEEETNKKGENYGQ